MVKRKYTIDELGQSVCFAGVAMFGGFLSYFYYLFSSGISGLSGFISVLYLIPFDVGLNPSSLVIFASDFPKISYVLNSLLNGSFLLVFLPFIFAFMISAVGALIWKKKGEVRVLGYLLIPLVVLAILSFIITFTPVTLIVITGAMLLIGLSVYVILYATWIILGPRDGKERSTQKS
ncbi:MAG: hypothetical protein ACUVXA_20150 [Candidatus Jordarchaeum sp.]|uniref:hypothetical protein n=1 Tax=Candidatus Jordarchaeum sp. TaxID=2823881 RepID=UPI00404A0194